MRQTNDGLTLWYGTPDAPAPPEEGARRAGTTLTIAVRPAGPANAVDVRYRVDGARVLHFPARELAVDHARQVQYFRATFPPIPEGRVVEYAPVLTSGGRQVPAPTAAGAFPSRFTLADGAPPHAEAKPAPPAPAEVPAPGQRFMPGLEFVSAVRARLAPKADVIGETPEGLRINFYLDGGDAVGPGLNATLRPRGADFLTIRNDGVGTLQVRATFQTDDGCLLDAEYTGFLNLGDDGYRRAVDGQFPQVAPVQIALRFLTASPKYAWMNRHQFIGVGCARLAPPEVDYDLFVVTTRPDAGPA